MTIRQSSHVFASAAMYMTDQPLFWNMVILVETSLDPYTVLLRCKEIEARLGRDLAPAAQRYGPRSMDIDLLLAFADDPRRKENAMQNAGGNVNTGPGSICINEPTLTIPHPLLTERAFVLYPLLQCAPALRLPETDRVLASFLPQVADQECRDIGLLAKLRKTLRNQLDNRYHQDQR